MKKNLLPFAPDSLGLGSIDNTSHRVVSFYPMDYGTRADAGVENDATAIRVVTPNVTRDIMEDHAPELVESYDQWVTDNPDADDDDRATVWDETVAEWSMSDSHAEWIDSLWPAMNFFHPVRLPYGANESDVAARVRELAGSVTLICLSEDSDDSDAYAFALTGGGMDFSDCLARAYLAAGQVPHHGLLASSWAHEENKVHPLAPYWRAALVKAAELNLRRASDLERQAAEIEESA